MFYSVFFPDISFARGRTLVERKLLNELREAPDQSRCSTCPRSFWPLEKALPWSVTATEWEYPALTEVTRISWRDTTRRGTACRPRVGSLPIINRCLTRRRGGGGVKGRGEGGSGMRILAECNEEVKPDINLKKTISKNKKREGVISQISHTLKLSRLG